MTRVSFFGGNGHCAARLAAARRHLSPGIELIEAPYPGFEGRPRAASLEEFLAALAESLRAATPDLVYATGIGALLALGLRARDGSFDDLPLLFQGPVLWGLERRTMPRLMRLAPARAALRGAFSLAAFQGWFARRYFTRPLPAAERAAFFAGYADCAALPDLFAWIDPALLRTLAVRFAERPAALGRIAVWEGGRDRVVGPAELAATEAALGPGAHWPVRLLPDWGHYPMLDEPAAWARALSEIGDAAKNAPVA